MPRPKPNMSELLNEYFLSKGLNIIQPDEATFNTNTPITIICPKNSTHTYKASISQIKTGRKDISSCPHCDNETKYKEMGIPEKTVKEYAEKNKLDYFPKKDFYNRWEDKITFKCINDNYTFDIKALKYWEEHKLSEKVNCPECQKVINGILPMNEYKEIVENIQYEPPKVDISKYQSYDLSKLPTKTKELIESQDKWMLIEYTNTKSKCKYLCKTCGAIKECYPTTLFYGRGFGCQGCRSNQDKARVYDKFKTLMTNSNMYPLDSGNDIFTHTENYIKIKCNECGHEFERQWYHLNMLDNVVCPQCHKSIKRASQMEVYNWIKTIYSGSIIPDCRDFGFELDIYIPDKKIAIEYCGLIWHSTKYREDKQYHREKMKKCKSLGIRLITMFEDEWNNKKNICQSRIKNALGLIDKKIFAKECSVNKIDNTVALAFCKENHIQGRGKAVESYGLFYNDLLVSVMTFSYPDKKMKNADITKYDYELNRFCSLLEYNIVGGASRLLSAFRKDNSQKRLYTFCDLRWGTGNVYEKMGFTYSGYTRLDYYYFGKLTEWKRKHRSTFTKSKIKELYPQIYDENKTEEELTRILDVYRIYGCGHKRYELVC